MSDTHAVCWWQTGIAAFVLVFGLFWTGLTHATAIYSANSPEEYQRKVEFILNFCRLTESPSKPFQTPYDNFVLGILGEDPIEPYLEALTAEKCVGHNIELARFTFDDDFTRAQILVIGNSEQDRLDAILEKLEGKIILTIADFENFASRGGMFEFSYQDIPESERENARKVRFRINVGAIEATGMRPSITLSKLGDVVATHTDAGITNSEQIRVAVLPPWEFPVPNMKGIKDGFFLSLSSNPSFRITHAVDNKLWGYNPDVQRLKFSETEGKRLWKQVGKAQHSEPNLEVAKELVSSLDVDAVFMYSSPAEFGSSKRGYLIDLESGRAFKSENFLDFEADGNYAYQAKAIGDELLGNFLDDLADPRIRVAVLPGKKPYRITIPSEAFNPLTTHKGFIISHIADPELSGLNKNAHFLDIGNIDIWSKSSEYQFSNPLFEGIKNAVEDLDVDVVFTYTAAISATYFGPLASDYNLKLLIIDIRTGEVFQTDGIIFSNPPRSGNDTAYSAQWKLTNELIQHFLNGSASPKSSFSVPSNQYFMLAQLQGYRN